MKKIFSYGMIPIVATVFQLAKPAWTLAQEPSKIEQELTSIYPLCQRDIKIASVQIQKIMDEYSVAVKERNCTYIEWRSSPNPKSDLEKYGTFNRAQVRVRNLESDLSKHIDIINSCKPGR